VIAMNIQLKPEVQEKLTEIARDGNLPVEKACEFILDQFARIEGGRIYAGTWKEGSGLMFLVQWPFLTGLLKISSEELTKMGVK